jgi:hypothetical protein
MEGIAAVANAQKEAKVAALAAAKALEEKAGAVSEVEQAIRDLLAAEKELTIGDTRIAESFVELESKGVPAITGLLKVVTDLKPQLEAVKNETVGLSDQTQQYADVIGQALTESFSAALINGEGFTETLGTYFENLAKKIIAAAIAAAALAAILSVTGLGGGMKFLDIGKQLFGGFSGIPGFANGGQTPGGLTSVGERGAELVNMPRNAQVTPNNELHRMNGKFGSTVEVQGVITGNSIFLSNERTSTTRTRTRG